VFCGNGSEAFDEQLKDATEKGAKVVLGGTHEGQFYHPTVLTGVTPDMRIYHEESFGPVVSVIRADDSEDALRIANDTDYGLAAAVITNDMQKALDLSMRLESGMVHVNDTDFRRAPCALRRHQEQWLRARGRPLLAGGADGGQVGDDADGQTRFSILSDREERRRPTGRPYIVGPRKGRL
jgi:hypothetical protein